LERPEETAKVMTSDGYIRTGDIGIMSADGFLKIVDRKKDMILVSGFNVYPNEVEGVIASHPGVLECAVIGVPDEKSIEAVKAFVVKKDPNITAQDIIKFASTQLTNYKVPSTSSSVPNCRRPMSARSCAVTYARKAEPITMTQSSRLSTRPSNRGLPCSQTQGLRCSRHLPVVSVCCSASLMIGSAARPRCVRGSCSPGMWCLS